MRNAYFLRRLAIAYTLSIAFTTASGSSARADDELDVRGLPDRHFAPSSLVFLDSHAVTTSVEIAGGPIWFRSVHDNAVTQGVFETRVGRVYTSAKWPFFLEGARYIDIRVFDGKSYQASLQQELAGSIALGALEPEVKIGAHLLEVDVFKGSYNVGLLSPRVSAGLGIRATKFRLDISVYSEYLWRWFGANYFVHGVVIGIASDTKSRKLRGFAEAPDESSAIRF